MIALWKQAVNWFLARILAMIQSDDLLELKNVTTEKVTFNSVMLHNEMILHNRLWLPFTLIRIRGDLFNEQMMKIGWIELEEPVRVRGRSSAVMIVETHLSHITALFNVLRFWVKDSIPMQLNGKVWLKVLWWNFSLPLNKTLHIDRNTISYVARSAKKQVPEFPDMPIPMEATAIIPDEDPGIVVAPPPPAPLAASPLTDTTPG